jgi:hypothetical protein
MSMTRARCVRIVERAVGDLETGRTPAPCRELYVFGSFSRGALVCGDLDLVIIHDQAPRGRFKRFTSLKWQLECGQIGEFKRAMRRAISRPGERIDVLTGGTLELALKGTPIKAEHCKMIWQVGDDAGTWRRRLAAITPDPAAASHKKKIIDPRRFNFHSRAEIEELEAQLEAGTLVLRRIPMESIDHNLEPAFQHWLDHWLRCRVMGDKSLALLPYGIWWLQQHMPAPISTRSEDLTFWIHRTILSSNDKRLYVSFGRPGFGGALRLAGKSVDRKICLIPHWKKGQPNELLEFTPGTPADIDVSKNILHRQMEGL